MNVDAVEPMQKKLSSLPRLAIYPWIVWGLGAAFLAMILTIVFFLRPHYQIALTF